MLRFLKRPEVVYCLAVAVLMAALCLLTGQLSAYFLFFFVYVPLLKAPILLVPIAGVPLAAYLLGGPGLRSAAKWTSLTVVGFVLGIAGIIAIALGPNWLERNLAWGEAYAYRFIIEVDTDDGVKSADLLVSIEKKRFSLSGRGSGRMGVLDRLRLPGSLKIDEGISVGFPRLENSVFDSLYTDTLRRLNLPLDGEYKGKRLEVDKGLFPWITVNHLRNYDPATLSRYRDALAHGRFRLLVELIRGTPEVPHPADQVCAYLLTLEVRTPDGPKRAEATVRILREVGGSGSQKNVWTRAQAGDLRSALADDLAIVLRFQPSELITLPQRYLRSEDRERLRVGDRVEVPHALIDEQHYGGPLLTGGGLASAIKKYRLLVQGKAEYVLRLEMLDGTVIRNTDWNDPDWGPSGSEEER
ncbi:hypothetical protein [Pseudodesulfovibrio methanolicus]|uniref:Uncharacterized protein n=1 Tax=Pseudodesulfovibrio methanolicus TaxID=3126690 RepID=A0ABZ2IXP1_9BACT